MKKQFGQQFSAVALLLGCFAASSVLLPSSVQAIPGFTYLDDEGEAAYDVTAKLNAFPAELSLNEQENGDGYRLVFNANTIEMILVQNKVPKTLRRYGKGLPVGSVVIQRRGPIWRVIGESRIIFEVDDTTFHDGKVGFKGVVAEARVQPTEDIAFDDDFMRVAADVAVAAAKEDPRKGVSVKSVENKETVWTNLIGTWKTTGLTENEAAQVAQSANPFVFQSNAKDKNLSIAGKIFWDDYQAEVRVKPEGASAIGLAVYVADAKNYLLLHWKESGPLQLQSVVNGKMQVLDELQMPFDQNQWYQLRVSSANGWVRAYLDDAEVLRSRTGWFGRGHVGLYAENPSIEKSAVFDDVSVRSIRDFADDFTAPVAGRWKTVSGNWDFSKGLSAQGAGGSFIVMGENDWNDYQTSAQITLPANAVAGLVQHYQSGKGAYILRIAGSKAAVPYAGRLQIVKTAGGKTETLGETSIGSRFDGKTFDCAFLSEKGYLKGEVEGVRLLDAFDDSLEGGRPGLFAQGDVKSKATPRFLMFGVEFPRSRPTWAKVPDIMATGVQPETMGGWSTPEGSWIPMTPLASPGGAKVTPISTGVSKTFWHKGAFWGDGSVKFKLPVLLESQKIDLIFGDPARVSYVLTLRQSGQTLKTVLSRLEKEQSRELAKGDVKLEGKVVGQPVEL
ncbi:MAG TPA: hypothetical protein VGB77_07840, partial [Abditibacteriaceae bacterium]